MSKRAKLLGKLRTRPRDFTWDELKRVLGQFGYVEQTNSGSRRKFIGVRGEVISLHKPHPGNVLKLYQIDMVLDHFRQEGIL
jgi:hypothetical protein